MAKYRRATSTRNTSGDHSLYVVEFDPFAQQVKTLHYKVFKGNVHIASSTSREACERIAALVEGEVRP